MIITEESDGVEALLGDWKDIEIEVMLGAGCVDHVMDAAESPGYCLLESAGSRGNQNLAVANGYRCLNKGDMQINLETNVGTQSCPLKSVFQIADITRHLMPFSKIRNQ